MSDTEEWEFEFTKVTKTTRTIHTKTLLYGKDTSEYEDVDIDELLTRLTVEELEQLSNDVDPDDSLLPPSQRCKDQTTKAPTGPLNRKKLLEFLSRIAREQEDWPEMKPFQAGVKRGKIWVPKEKPPVKEEDTIELDIEDDDTQGALNGATESELVDLAAILGLHSMLNQDQYHNSILNKGQKLGDRFESIVRATIPRALPFEPDNDTDPEKTADQVAKNDKSLKTLNWNNVKNIPRETFVKLFNGLKTNTNLESLSMANTALTDGPAVALVEALKDNKTLTSLNLESNYLSGPMIRDIVNAMLINQSVKEFRATNQRPQILGNRVEMEIAKAVEQNRNLLRLGLALDVPDARMRVTHHLQMNNDYLRLKRMGFQDALRERDRALH